MSTGRTEWGTLLAAGNIPRREFSRILGDDEKIKNALRFIFQQNVTQLLAWGVFG